MPVKLKEIGAVVPKSEHWESGQRIGFNTCRNQSGEIPIGHNRERLVERLFKSKTGHSKAQMTKLLLDRYSHDFNICECDIFSLCNLHIWLGCEQEADDIIADEKSILEVVK